MNEKRKRLLSGLSSLIIFSTIFSPLVLAQDLNKKVKELEQKMTWLEQRIVKLEGIILQSQNTQAKPMVASPSKWKDKASWRLLKKGMGKDEVRQILGEPPKIVANIHYGDIWYYPDTQGGNVSFDKENVLTSWSEI
jgi:hypothetical protein